MDIIERFIILLGTGVAPIITLIISLRQNFLEKKKDKQKGELANYNFTQNGNYNQMNVLIKNNTEQEKYFKLLYEIEMAEQKQHNLNKIAQKIEQYFIKFFILVVFIIASKNLYLNWKSHLNLFENSQNITLSLYNAFQSAGQVMIYMIFSLSFVLILSLLTSSSAKFSFRNISLWIYILIINIGNIYTLTLWKEKTLGEEFIELQKYSQQIEHSPTLNAILEYLLPTLILLQICAAFIVANHLTKLILVHKVYSPKTKRNVLISTIFLVSVPFIYRYFVVSP
ncbi:hypothetical protein ABD67_01145 [Bacillus sonorensis]|uniref:hypothetical protein n=1 Tax=Bacillus sonorensis TaxID=119858 RepID=UPI0018CD2F63|nr:hypothetical protein [Bacillus sonorensis]MBG9913538.1 hypothetical protein [Bacillus sonorensis]